MGKGLVNIIMRVGNTKSIFLSELEEKDAIEICESYNYELTDGNGLVWDLEID